MTAKTATKTARTAKTHASTKAAKARKSKSTTPPAIAEVTAGKLSIRSAVIALVKAGYDNAVIKTTLSGAPWNVVPEKMHLALWHRSDLCRQLERSKDPAERALAATYRATRAKTVRADVHAPPAE